jgi:hypothetical protein
MRIEISTSSTNAIVEHADSFMDVPRLSTLQANLIVLKARESAPKRGYYFRSWMTVVQCVQMAKDLGLDEHYEEHKAGRPCGSELADCITKTRVWQTIFICELMIGSPQGQFYLKFPRFQLTRGRADGLGSRHRFSGFECPKTGTRTRRF